MILTIYNHGKSDIVVFWHKFNRRIAEKANSVVTTDQQPWKYEINVESITNRHKILSKTVTLFCIITKTVRFNYIRSSRRQVPREIQP